MTVYDGLWVARGARGIDDPEGMLERNVCGGVSGFVLGDLIPCDVPFRERPNHRQCHKGSDTWQTCIDLGKYLAAIHLFTRMHIAVLRDQHFRCDLLEAIQDRNMPHIRRAK